MPFRQQIAERMRSMQNRGRSFGYWMILVRPGFSLSLVNLFFNFKISYQITPAPICAQFKTISHN